MDRGKEDIDIYDYEEVDKKSI